MSKRIACFHLFNDFSGSPKVLHDILSGLLDKGYEIDLITTRGGVLDNLDSPRLHRRYYRYSFSPNPIVTMLRYSLAQLMTFLMALRYAFRKDTLFYINTILPLGPAIAGRITGKRVIYHYHENAFVKGAFYRTLAKAMQRIAHRIICVSSYQGSYLSRKNDVDVIPNALSHEFISRLCPDPTRSFDRHTVLMLSSLKTYKGTHIFIRLASLMPQFRFVLVINDTSEAITAWIESKNIKIPDNITIHPRSSDVARFYNQASLVVNLSNPDLFIETFGLTALEAMSCALPVIVPVKGGIAEMITDNVNGFKIDCKDTHLLSKTIRALLSDRENYERIANNALTYSCSYSRDAMIGRICNVLEK